MRPAILPSAVVLAALVGCKASPAGMSSATGGDSWVLPLVGPLEDGLLLTPVSINDTGPFVFAIDPDAAMSIVDEEVVREARLRVDNSQTLKLIDESNTPQPHQYAEILNVELGDLRFHDKTTAPALVVKRGTLDSLGRHVQGVIGRNVLPDSLVLGFDRDRGIAVLTATERFRPPAETTPIPYTDIPSQLVSKAPPAPRRIAKAEIGGVPVTMHLDLGAYASQLREDVWAKANLTAEDKTTSTVDEVGSIHPIAKATTADIALAGLKTEHVFVVPYDDRRWQATDLDGTLGLDFFRPYSVWLDLTKRTYYLRPRKPVEPAKRLARWNDIGGMARCQHPGCVTVKLIDPLANKPPPTPAPTPPEGVPPPPPPDGATPPPEEPAKHPGVVLSIVRDEIVGGMDLEVLIAATSADGKPLPRLVISIPGAFGRVMDHLGADWVGATLTVIDASPYPRPCAKKGACIDKLAP
jgi:hypothetical protein